MLDVARLESQVVTPHLENIKLGIILRLIQKDYVQDLEERKMTIEIDEAINSLPASTCRFQNY